MKYLKLNLLLLLVLATTIFAQTKKPNILWIYVEDIDPLISCYGVNINPTPNIDKLAKNGVMFKRAFSPSPVCSSTRSGIITGTMPTTLGLHNHHSSRTVESAIFLPDSVKTLPEIFKDNGYYTFNWGKDDYNFIYDRSKLYSGTYHLHFWYTFSGDHGKWSDLPKDKPFFGQIQLEGGKDVLPQRKKHYDEKLPKNKRVDRNKVKLPPYYPEDPYLHEDWAMHYDAVRMTDMDVKEIINGLKRAGLLNNTYVFFFSDHGYKGTRDKQFCYDGGLQVPLIIAYYGDSSSLPKNEVRNDLVSLLDVSATALGLADLQVPNYFESVNLFSINYSPREYIISVRDRCDFSIDRIRTVRSNKFRYIKNFMTDRPYTQPNYKDTRPEFIIQKKLYEEGKLNEDQAWFWSDYRPSEELYDLDKDPYQLHNIADKDEYKAELIKHRNILENWIKETDDKGQYPETSTLQGREALRFMYERWGNRCVNPEFDIIKKNPIPGAPKVDIKRFSD